MFKNIPKLLFVIFILALLLRTIKLDTFPVGFHADEVKAGWNAYSILQTGLDDRLQNISLYYNSFGDYRPTGIFFFIIPSIIIFGLNEFAVRFPSALFGALTVFPLYFFVYELKTHIKALHTNKNLALTASFFLAILPWHIEVSRATSEVVISTFFAITSLYFLLRLIKDNNRKFLLLSCGSILLSYLLYHSIRLLAPLFFISTIAYYYEKIKNNRSQKIVITSLLFVLALTTLFSLTTAGKQRFNQVSIFNDQDTIYEIDRLKSENGNNRLLEKTVDSPFVVYTKRFISEYSSYFNSSFLIGSNAKPYRYTTPGTGLLTFVEYGLFVLGIFALVRKRNLIIIFLLLVAPLPAALTTEDAPNLHRALFMIPFLVLIEAYGVQTIINFKTKFKNLIILTIIIFGFGNFSYFMYMYFVHASYHKPYEKDFILDASSYRNYGSKELVLTIENEKNNYDKIIVTNSPDNVYPWYAFYTKKSAKEFNENKKELTDKSFQYENIIFSINRCPSDFFDQYNNKSLLIIDSGITDCKYEDKIKAGMKIKVVNKILQSNGNDAYVFLERDPKQL